MTKRQMIQSAIQFAVTLVAILTTMASSSGRFPTGFEAYSALLPAAGAALAIWAGAKIRTGGA